MFDEMSPAGMSNNNTTASSRRRTPGKPGRFEPSEPLHMTTRRHAARNSNDNGSPSISGSIDDNYSRRGSIDDFRPRTSHSLGSQHSVKDNEPTRSPTRKRKRSSPTPPETPIERPESPTDLLMFAKSREDDHAYPETSGAQVSDQESANSDVEGAAYGSYSLRVKPSTELTPADSEAVSPVSATSNANISLATKVDERKAGVKLPLQPEEPDEVDEVDEGADGDENDEADEADDLDDADDQAKGEGDSKSRRKFHGRRRADHHMPNIEAAMRRQLQLKSSFRAIMRALKPVLAEIALKTVEQLDQDPSKHQNVVEYTGDEQGGGVDQQLAMAFERRKAQLDAQLKWNKLQLQQTQMANRETSESNCALTIEQAREQHLSELEHQWLLLARQAQLHQQRESAETDDEDGDVVAKLKGMAYRCQRTTTLDPKYDSRSRVGIETRRAIEDLQLRFEMFQMLNDETGEQQPRVAGFTVMDNERRQLAMAHRDACANIQTLLAASEEEERRAKLPIIPVIANEKALGLQLLGDLVSRPIFDRAPALLPPPRHLPDVGFGQLGHHAMRPPLRPPIHMEGYEHDMSPRALHYPDRFTPSQTYHTHSRHGSYSDTSRRESHLISPASNHSRIGSFVPLAMKGVEHEHDIHRAGIAPYHYENYDPGAHRGERPDSSYRDSRERDDIPTEYYHRRQFSFDPAARYLPPPDRSVHDFSRGGPLVIERIEPGEPVRQGQRGPVFIEDQGPHTQAYPPQPARWDAPQSPGRPESRRQERPSPAPKSEMTREETDAKAVPPRNASLNLSAADFNGSKVRAPRQPRHKGVKINFGTKGTKSERIGTTRRSSKAQSHDEKRPAEPSPPHEAGPSMHRFRLNTDQRPRTPQHDPPWQGSPPRTAPLPLPPSEYIYTSQYGHFAPPPTRYGYGPNPYEPHHPYPPHQQTHRPSGGLGPPTTHSGPPPLPQPPGGWQHQPTSPLYGVPQPYHNASDPWQHPPPPPPPAGYSRPLSSRDGPPSSSMGQPPPPGSPYGPSHFGQYGGPPLAPATPDGRIWHAGSGPAQGGVPAFAQQQRQQEGSNSSTGGRPRRRTNSDVPANSKFQHWAPRRRD